jgi:predicted enzyme related to lactoylglutathione lyase
MAIQVLGVDNILLSVGDLNEAQRFYGEQLGLPLKFSFEAAGIAGYRLGNEEPGLLLRVAPISPAPARATPRLWLEVPDAHIAAEHLAAQGIAVLQSPFEVATGWAVEVADPWGNVIGFTDYRKDPARARSQSTGMLPTPES